MTAAAHASNMSNAARQNSRGKNQDVKTIGEFTKSSVKRNHALTTGSSLFRNGLRRGYGHTVMHSPTKIETSPSAASFSPQRATKQHLPNCPVSSDSFLNNPNQILCMREPNPQPSDFTGIAGLKHVLPPFCQESLRAGQSDRGSRACGPNAALPAAPAL